MSELQYVLSNCVSKIPTSPEDILSALENGFLSTSYPIIPVKDVKEKLVEFQNFLNSVGRISMLHAGSSDREEIVFLLLSLKKCFQTTLTELGKARTKTPYSFNCSQCTEHILVNPDVNIWYSLQQHLHIEEAYALKRFNTSNNVAKPSSNDVAEALVTESITSNVTMTFLPENNYNGIAQDENNTLDRQVAKNQLKENCSHVANNVSEESITENVNSFRFNFHVHYDADIETKLYPDLLVKSVRKYDQVPDYTILKASNYRAVCLLCPCDLVANRTKMSKPFILDHVMGQRHLRSASNPSNLNALKCFHETWLNLNPLYQAHQLYFRPEEAIIFKCILCNDYVYTRELKKHIFNDPHRRIVITIFERNDKSFFLTDLQIQLYGPEFVEKAQQRIKEFEDQKQIQEEAKKRQIKVESESSPSPESKELVHNIIKSVENPKSKHVFDLLPNRMKDHLKYFELDKNGIICKLCNVLFPPRIEILKRHIGEELHWKTCDVKHKKYKYFCEICNIKYTDEVSWHNHILNPPNKHIKLPPKQKQKVTEYECTACFTVLYGDENSTLRHFEMKKGKRVKEIKLSETVKKMFRSKESIELEGNKLTEESSKTLQYSEMTMICCSMLEKALTPHFGSCKAYPFGSRISGLGNKFSDLDVFLDVGGMYEGNKDQDSRIQVQLVRRAAKGLLKSGEEFKDVYQIPTARTPIVKFHHEPTGIDCDVSFRHGLSVENTKFLRFCIDIQPITQPFILILKKWSEHGKLSEHITTYALAMLAIFYLQIHQHLLSVTQIRNANCAKPLVINGWETLTYTKPLEQMKKYVTPYPHSLHRLLRDFFSYFVNFKYSDLVICPLLGRIIKKEAFLGDGKELPIEMSSYVAQLQGPEPEQFRALSVFCIQDPFDLSHNLTKALQPATLNKFKTLCQLSVKHLESVN